MNALTILPEGHAPACPGCGTSGCASLPCLCEGHDAALAALIAQAMASDPEGADHPRRVGSIAALLAEALGVAPGEQALLARAAALHDIGKLALPGGVLGHGHVLDPASRREMERHPLLGASILAHARAPWMRLAGAIALEHHERWDGSGYPRGLEREEILLAARVVAVADVYDALRSERPYKGAQDHEEAMGRLIHGDGRIAPGQFDPQVLAALQRVTALQRAMPR